MTAVLLLVGVWRFIACPSGTIFLLWASGARILFGSNGHNNNNNNSSDCDCDCDNKNDNDIDSDNIQ